MSGSQGMRCYGCLALLRGLSLRASVRLGGVHNGGIRAGSRLHHHQDATTVCHRAESAAPVRIRVA